jgi:hypothetical protein
VQALNACDTLTDRFTVTTVDGTPQVVTITIHGTDDVDRDDFYSGAHDFEPSSIAHVVFGSADTLGVGDSFHFKDEISGVAGSATTNLADGGHTLASISEIAAGTHGTPAISEEAQPIELSLPGQHAADNFNIDPHRAEGVVVTHVSHDLMV